MVLIWSIGSKVSGVLELWELGTLGRRVNLGPKCSLRSFIVGNLGWDLVNPVQEKPLRVTSAATTAGALKGVPLWCRSRSMGSEKRLFLPSLLSTQPAP